ncbi:hypothetical protein [Streptomyces sp. NPDC005989]|uniref:hypothetical protein n=1 Tax=unclassified Streptomyces TaxID=2593676 RepID=UPI0033FC7889
MLQPGGILILHISVHAVPPNGDFSEVAPRVEPVGDLDGGGRLTVVLDLQRWMELRRSRGLFESGAMSLSEIARETGLNRRTVAAARLRAHMVSCVLSPALPLPRPV